MDEVPKEGQRAVRKVVVFFQQKGDFVVDLRTNILKKRLWASQRKSNETRDYNGVRNDYLSRQELENKSKVMKTQRIYKCGQEGFRRQI